MTTVAPNETSGPEPDLWSTILNEVSTARGILSKNLVVLGSPSTGKTTLISQLKGKGQAQSQAHNYSLGYTYIPVSDPEDDSLLGRIGVYQLPSYTAPYPELLKLALAKATLQDSVVVIMLDWTTPDRFVEELSQWLRMLEAFLADPALAQSPEVREAQERLQNEVKISGGEETLLTLNLGIPIVIVCTKSDNMNVLEQDHEYSDEKFDYIQQSLRTIALQYAASIFHTSTLRPETFRALKSYLLYRLFSQNSKAFAFSLPANVVDRDQIVVPAGWDSIGKIRVQNKNFSPEDATAEWSSERTLSAYSSMITPVVESVVPVNTQEIVEPQDESQFFKELYEASQNDDDARSTFTRQLNDPTVMGSMFLQSSVVDAETTGSATETPDSLSRAESVSKDDKSTSPGASTVAAGDNEALNQFFQSLISTRKSPPNSRN